MSGDFDGNYIRQYYGVPATLGTRVIVDGRPGVIVGFQDGKLLVHFASDGTVGVCHPTWHMVYIAMDGTVAWTSEPCDCSIRCRADAVRLRRAGA